MQRDDKRNTPTNHSLEGLLFDLKNLISIKYLCKTDINAFASTSFANSTLFSGNNNALWHGLLQRDFNFQCRHKEKSKDLYALLAERQRLVVYAQFLLNPIKEMVTAANPNRLPQPWMIDIQVSDKSRYHAMSVLRDPLMKDHQEDFINAARSYMKPIDTHFLARQTEELNRIYHDIFLDSPDRSLRTLYNHLVNIQNLDHAGVEIDRLGTAHDFNVLISILSKCGAIRSLRLLFNNIRINPIIHKMFYDRYGAELCIDAIHYHRPAMVRLLLSSQEMNHPDTLMTPNTSSNDLIPEEAPINYAAANSTAYNTEYMEDRMLTPLACAINSLRAFYTRVCESETINQHHHQRLREFQQIFSLLIKAHANPDNAIVELDLESRLHHISLSTNTRDLARSLLEVIQRDRRIDVNFQAQLVLLLESIIEVNVIKFQHERYADYWTDSSNDSSHEERDTANALLMQRPDVHQNDDDEEQVTPTKRTKLDQLSLRSPRK